TRDTQEAATQAAAGMLAPQAEALPEGPFLDLGLKSLSLYPDWIQKLEAIANASAGYWPCGILAPQYQPQCQPHQSKYENNQQPSAIDRSPPKNPLSAQRRWIAPSILKSLQPHLDPDVVGAWWFPEEGQVDPPKLAQVLRMVAETLGIDVKEGITIEALQQAHGRITAVQTSEGSWHADHYILATGSWSSVLLPLPVYPIKGQLFSVQADPGMLNQVLYGPGIYIVPRQEGRIVIGATSETVGFTPHNTPAGLQTLLNGAIKLYPPLQDCPNERQWWGFRPATPDEWPILGTSHCDNLTLATGHHRNGILLAPVTARLIADHILGDFPSDLLSAFNWQRFS
ncbi:glycine oxidase ThiO, partial [Okeania sp. SIO2G5]|uniref:glycine oxidase ThiO n=1 Tax=Okeania sp. SIO2G5 TaxID=2607796 RepID=UPI0013C1DA7B